VTARTEQRSRLLDRLAVLIVLLAGWQVLSVRLGTYWVSSPALVVTRIWSEIRDGDLLFQAGFTLEEAMVGFLLGGLPAAILPFLLRRSPRMVAILDPFMVGGYGLPKLALAPLFILWFGIDIESKIALVAIATFFIVYFATLAGVRSVDLRLVGMARVLGASERQIARHIVWPAAVPHVFAGFRVALPYAIGGAVVAEMISSNRGLGYFIQAGAMNFDTTQIFVAVAAVTLIVLVTASALSRCEAHLLRWRPPALPQALRAETSL
jgi:NitT/TauT family transport system permease protein